MRPFLFSLLLLSFAADAAKVIDVTDGDTLTILENNKPVNIRLANIDAPEPGQPFANRSRQSLSDLCLGKSAIYRERSTDRTGRIVAIVECDDVEANRAQLKRGMAWVNLQEDMDPTLIFLQDWIFSERTGLWADFDPVPPWEWRKRNSGSGAKRLDINQR